jgi:signal transduction histidine kinase
MSLLKKLQNSSLREKFVLVVSLVIVSSMLIISGYLIKRQNEIYHQELVNRGQALVVNLAYNAEFGVILESESDLKDLLKGVARADDIVYAQICAEDDRVLAEIGIDEIERLKDFQDKSEESETMDKYTQRTFFDSDDIEYIEISYPVQTRRQQVSRENLGTVFGIQDNSAAPDTEVIGTVRLALTTANLAEEITRSQTAAIILTIMVVFSAIIIMTAFVRIITQPIKTLVDVTDQISKGDLSKSVNISRRDEIGLLSESFNRMIESLKESQGEIEEYNRTLEAKIIERTRELEDAQSQLIQSEKLAGIGQLAAGVAHELNNPLGGILGYAQFTLEKMQKKDLPELSKKDYESFKKYLRDIENQTRRCKAIVQNLLRFSRSSNKVEFSDTDINQVLEETLTFVEHQLVMNQIGLTKELDPKIPIIEGNPGQLQQVFTNMIINGLHASPSGTQMTVTSKYLPPLGEFPGAIEIDFSDQGVGISEENMKKIFEPFFTTKEVGKGTGLGLSVSYGIIKDHGGEIKVKSKVGVGTTFSIIIPLEKKAASVDKAEIEK